MIEFLFQCDLQEGIDSGWSWKINMDRLRFADTADTDTGYRSTDSAEEKRKEQYKDSAASELETSIDP